MPARCRMAPGGIEPPHAGSKPAALSTELRGRSRSVCPTVRRYPVRVEVAVAQLVEPRVVVPVVAGSSPVRHLSTLHGVRPRSSADRAAGFEPACGGSTPPGAIRPLAPMRDPRGCWGQFCDSCQTRGPVQTSVQTPRDLANRDNAPSYTGEGVRPTEGQASGSFAGPGVDRDAGRAARGSADGRLRR